MVPAVALLTHIIINGCLGCCRGGHVDMVRWLLQMGASLDELDLVGNTPLLYAIYGGHLEVGLASVLAPACLPL
jgi:ankyrin repeat protein